MTRVGRNGSGRPDENGHGSADGIDVDVAVVGTGPAGWAAAAACRREGLAVAVIGPAPSAGWVATYGCWLDELEALGLVASAARRFDTVIVEGTRHHEPARTYALIDNARLASELGRRAAGAELVESPVRRARRTATGWAVVTSDGRSVGARVVVDASGHHPALVWRPTARRSPAIQAASGVVARFDRPPAPPDSCVLMDWRPAPGAAPDVPTFFYALDLGDGWFLAEETSLARSPAVGIGELDRRLAARLARAGCHPVEVRGVEHVAIPMGLAVPPAQSVVGFGSAAGFVHPATGYSVVASLRLAPVLARSIVAGLAADDDPDRLAVRAWEAIWPADRRRVRALQEYGLGVLLGLDARATARFFDAFFELPAEASATYLDPLAELADVIDVMRRLFAAAPWRLRAVLMGGELGKLLTAARSGPRRGPGTGR